MDKLKEAHDHLLANMPEGESHDSAACHICNVELVPEKDSDERGEMETFTKEEVDATVEAAVKAAVTPVQAKLDEMIAAQTEGEVAQEVADAKAEAAEAIKAIQADLDAKVVEAAAAAKTLEDTLAFLAELDGEAKAAEAAEATKLVRLEEMAKVVSFPQDHIDKYLDKWVAMSDEDFAAQLETWALIAPTPAAESAGAEKITETVLSSVRPEKSSSESSVKSGMQAVAAARRGGVSVKTL